MRSMLVGLKITCILWWRTWWFFHWIRWLFFFGWWPYWAFPMFPFFGGFDHEMASANLPCSQNMELNLSDSIAGVFWLIFLFYWTSASIVSDTGIERIRSSRLWIHAVMIGFNWWIIDADCGCYYRGWVFKGLATITHIPLVRST